MKVRIKNITGDSFNESCIRELNRSGVATGVIIKGRYREINQCIEFRAPNGDDCVAWLGQTCEEVVE